MVLACAALWTGLTACGDEGEAGSEAPSGRRGPGGGRPGGRAVAAVPVKAEPAVRYDMVGYIQTHARLEAERRVSVVSRATGMVKELLVEEGSRVRRNDVLARLDEEELALRVQQVKVNLNQALTTYERNKVLHQRNMISQADYEATRNQVENLRVQLEEAQLNLQYIEIRAPIDGLVMTRNIELGDLVRSNEEVFSVADLEPLLARIYIPERRMRQVREGQEARIVIDALPDSAFAAKIRMISPGVDPQSGTVKVTLEIPAKDRLLRPGMFASVRIITERRPKTLVVPKKALILETDDDDVFVVREGKVERTSVKLGLTEGDRVEILQGLEEGDKVVTVGQEGLKDGMAVRLIGDDSGGPAGEVAAEAGQRQGKAPEAVVEGDQKAQKPQRTAGAGAGTKR